MPHVICTRLLYVTLKRGRCRKFSKEILSFQANATANSSHVGMRHRVWITRTHPINSLDLGRSKYHVLSLTDISLNGRKFNPDKQLSDFHNKIMFYCKHSFSPLLLNVFSAKIFPANALYFLTIYSYLRITHTKYVPMSCFLTHMLHLAEELIWKQCFRQLSDYCLHLLEIPEVREWIYFLFSH